MTDQEILNAIDAKMEAIKTAMLEEIKSSIDEIGDKIIKNITTG
jgi:hypothetical protein